MRAIRDLTGNQPPVPLDLPYNGDLTVDSVTTRYKGSLVKVMDYDSIANGLFLTFAGLTTAMENIFGILEEEQPTSGNYLPNDTTYGMTRRKITPILPSTIIRAEYGQTDAAGTDTYDTGATGSAATTTFTISVTTADTFIGGWIYMLNGSEANYLHYVTDNSTAALTLATALNYTVASGDDFLVIQPATCRRCDFDATYTGIVSEVDDGSKTDPIVGLDHWITAPGLPMEKLDRDKHDNLYIPHARFYHDFLLPGDQTYTNVFTYGIKAS